MTWDAPGYFWLLLLIPVFFSINRLIAIQVRNRRKRFFSDDLFSKLQSHRWETGFRLREGLFYAGFFFLVTALAGPKIGTEIREVTRDQLDLIVALDLSLSMKAEDVRPNRLEKARFEINRLLDNLQNDQAGLIVFTGEAMLHCPLTTDYSAFRMFLDIAEPDIMPSTTTDFNPMFREASDAFEASQRNGEQASRVLLIFTDGEDHFNRYGDNLQRLTNMGVYIYTVGIGTEEGGNIPIYDPDSGRLVDFHRDLQGRVVTTRLEPEGLRRMAASSGGQYFQISRTAHNIEGFIRQLGQLERGTFAIEEITIYRNRFAIPAFLSMACFIFMLLIPGYKNPASVQRTK
jgi:Ca-activated chloride channel homolog